jgi:arylformamidase
VRLSARSAYVTFDDAIEHALSPQRHLDRLTAPVVVAYAEHDSPEFQRQSREFADALARVGRLRELLVGPGLNHFEIPETLTSARGLLGRAAIELMQLT